MAFNDILALCDKKIWDSADITLKNLIKDKPDKPEAYAMAAHVAIRQGNTRAARWLINKAQGLENHNIATRIEDICLDFYEANYEVAYRKIFPNLIHTVSLSHPVHLIAAYLCCLYNDVNLYKQIKTKTNLPGFENIYPLLENYLMPKDKPLSTSKEISWQPVDKVFSYLSSGDRLIACIYARFSEMFFPSEANSYAALGFFNLYAGFFKNAARNFHEALFRESEYASLVRLQQFYLFCRQQRFDEAIEIAKVVEQSGKLDAKGQAFLLEAMLRSNQDPEEIRKRLSIIKQHLVQTNKASPYIEVVDLRLQLFDKQLTREQIIAALRAHVDNKNCNPAYLYFYAGLIDKNEAAKYAARALELDFLYPDAQHWDTQTNHLNFEYAGMFIPKEHEGGAWPTQTQLKLLDILFLIPSSELAGKWLDFTAQHSLYTLEAGSARLLPFIYKKLSQTLPANEIAELDLLKGIWKKSYFENALQMKNISGIIKLLEENGTKVILLKGMASALALYDDLGSRPMSDIDILINQSDLPLTDTILRKKGWLCNDIPSSNRLRFSYASTYRHSNGSIIDVHWRPCENLNADFYDASDIGELCYKDFMGHKWVTLSPTMQLLCSILHGVEWNHLSPVRWVSDSLLILQKFSGQIDWNKIYNLAVKYHCLPILVMGLQFLQRYNQDFINSLPDKLKEALSADYSNDTLMKIRLRSRVNLASFEEAFAMLEYFRKRFEFKENDYLFICGGDRPEYIRNECEKRGIYWAAHSDYQTILAVKPAIPPYNFITIDANLSCTFQCMAVSI